MTGTKLPLILLQLVYVPVMSPPYCSDIADKMKNKIKVSNGDHTNCPYEVSTFQTAALRPSVNQGKVFNKAAQKTQKINEQPDNLSTRAINHFRHRLVSMEMVCSAQIAWPVPDSILAFRVNKVSVNC